MGLQWLVRNKESLANDTSREKHRDKNISTKERERGDHERSGCAGIRLQI